MELQIVICSTNKKMLKLHKLKNANANQKWEDVTNGNKIERIGDVSDG
jgi:hypothetical protein